VLPVCQSECYLLLRRAGERRRAERQSTGMMIAILISIGQVLTPYGDDFPICRRDMSGHRTLEST
jgi:hypothetical protein